MTPKQKAAQLRYLFSKELDLTSIDKKVINCALITVEEMISVLPFTDSNASLNYYSIHLKRYLEQVKHEIEKL